MPSVEGEGGYDEQLIWNARCVQHARAAGGNVCVPGSDSSSVHISDDWPTHE
jgi:hypothetical protein